MLIWIVWGYVIYQVLMGSLGLGMGLGVGVTHRAAGSGGGGGIFTIGTSTVDGADTIG